MTSVVANFQEGGPDLKQLKARKMKIRPWSHTFLLARHPWHGSTSSC